MIFSSPSLPTLAFCLMLLGAVGCGESKLALKQAVPIAEVPPELTAVAQKTLPNVAFDSAYKIKVKGEDVYEIRGKMPNGKVREVEVSTDGKVIEVE